MEFTFRAKDQWDRHGRSLLDAGSAQNPTRHDLTMVELNPCTLVFRTSTDALGSNWNAPVMPGVCADYPSLAVAQNGALVIGYNQTDSVSVLGFQSVVSTNGGGTWSGPFQITSGLHTAFGRVVASGNTFYYIYADTTSQSATVLRCAQSADGMNWFGCTPNPILDSYTPPANISPSNHQFCLDPPTCSQNAVIYYGAPNVDVSAASGLGWVVAYPAARTDNPTINNLKFCAQSLGGCTTITWGADLFLHGVTTSSNGDMWISALTHANNTGYDLPLRLLAVYRKSDGSYLSGFLQGANGIQGIDPTSWFVFPAPPKCSSVNCLFAGDYMRLGMNTFQGGATLPFVQRDSVFQTDLMQNFIQDPASGIPPVGGLQIGPMRPFGSISTSSIPLSEADLQRRPVDNHASIYYALSSR